MISRPTPPLDDRQAARILREVLLRRLGYLPDWTVEEKSVDWALNAIFSRYLETILQRLNQAPDKNRLAFFDTLGLRLVPAQSARAPIVFELAPDAPDSQAPTGTQLAAPPPPGSNDQVVFETEHALGIASARLVQVVSLWPGRDEYLDHTSDLEASQATRLFEKSRLTQTPHILFVAHETMLALSGQVRLNLQVELGQPGAEPLDVRWEYWDGKVWRGFKEMRPVCGEKADRADGTEGFQHGGRILLEADCAEARRTTVDGYESYWIRGRLEEPLPVDPAAALPEIRRLGLSSTIARPLAVSLTPNVIQSRGRLFLAEMTDSGSTSAITMRGTVQNDSGQPLQGAIVEVSLPGDDDFTPMTSGPTGPDGLYSFTDLPVETTFRIRVAYGLTEDVVDPDFLTEAFVELSGRTSRVDLVLTVSGLLPDQAFADATELDLTRPFYPFGQVPQPGSTFYFSAGEVFAKPGARLSIYLNQTRSPQDEVDVRSDAGPVVTAVVVEPDQKELSRTLRWEYWDGREWSALFDSSPGAANDFTSTGLVSIAIPSDIEPTTVNDVDGLWMRVRLLRGGFGLRQTVRWLDGANEFTYVIHKPPVLADFRLGYSWQHGPFPADRVVAYNDFAYIDYTTEARWAGSTFPPFRRLSDATPSLYLGFDKAPPVDRLGILIDIEEDVHATAGPAMLFEYWDGFQWRGVFAEDETGSLRRPGIISLIGPRDSRALARFSTPLYWLRGRLKEDGPPGSPLVNGIFPNAVWASQQRTYYDTVLGASTGLPSQAFSFTQFPVLPGERIEVREIAGSRAEVEWRLLTLELYGGDRRLLRDLEEKLAAEGRQTDIVYRNLRLKRDTAKKVREVWVAWEPRGHFFFSGARDRHYVLDRAHGRLLFGDGEQGRIPPPGAAISARLHRAGGGSRGNVPTQAIRQPLGALPGIGRVFNPLAAEGGADGESLSRFGTRAPESLRHRGRAVSATDYETLAREASSAVAFARAIPGRNSQGYQQPGWVTLILIPGSSEQRPWPSFGLREKVRKHVEARCSADLATGARIFVTGPQYLPIDIRAVIAVADSDEAGSVEQSARQALERFLHPVTGGPQGNGWALGRHLFLSDVSAVLERVEGLDYVRELDLMVDGVPQGERVAVGEDYTVVAGEIRLQILVSEV